MAATLRDVAALARVSVRTVSNVVSDYPHVSDQMRQRVLEAIDELGYRPNPVARTLRTGRTGLLALVVPEIDSPYFSELAREVISVATKAGYRVLVEPTDHDHELEGSILRGRSRSMLVDGVLFSPLATGSEMLEGRSAKDVPVVLLGEYRFDGRFDHVAIDNTRAAFDATSHLISVGCRRIAAIGVQPHESYSTPQQRLAGYTAALKAGDIRPDMSMTITVERYGRQNGYDAMVALLQRDSRPDGVFCFSDTLALGAIRAVFDSGLEVPHDVAIIGIDDIEEGRFTLPSLSSVSLDTELIAQNAVQQMLARLDDPQLRPREVVIPHRLVVRESTQRPH